MFKITLKQIYKSYMLGTGTCENLFSLNSRYPPRARFFDFADEPFRAVFLFLWRPPSGKKSIFGLSGVAFSKQGEIKTSVQFIRFRNSETRCGVT